MKQLLRRREYLTGVAVLHPEPAIVALARNDFTRYDNQQISFADHMTGVLGDETNISLAGNGNSQASQSRVNAHR